MQVLSGGASGAPGFSARLNLKQWPKTALPHPAGIPAAALSFQAEQLSAAAARAIRTRTWVRKTESLALFCRGEAQLALPHNDFRKATRSCFCCWLRLRLKRWS